MNSQVWWFVARSSGIIAWALLTLSVVWGLLLSTKVSATRIAARKLRPAWILDLHRHLGGLAVIFTAIHLIGIAADSYVTFGWADIFVPMASEWKPGAVAFGVVSLYLLLAIEATSLADPAVATNRVAMGAPNQLRALCDRDLPRHPRRDRCRQSVVQSRLVDLDRCRRRADGSSARRAAPQVRVRSPPTRDARGRRRAASGASADSDGPADALTDARANAVTEAHVDAVTGAEHGAAGDAAGRCHPSTAGHGHRARRSARVRHRAAVVSAHGTAGGRAAADPGTVDNDAEPATAATATAAPGARRGQLGWAWRRRSRASARYDLTVPLLTSSCRAMSSTLRSST